MAWKEERRKEYQQKYKEVILSGGKSKIEKEHLKGKLTARERMEQLFDNGYFQELNSFTESRNIFDGIEKKHYMGDGVITGYGMVDGRIVYAASQDCMISGGAGGEAHIQKICHALELAIKTKSPMVFFCDSGGARIEEGILSLSAYSRLFYLNTKASGYIPQIAAVMGNCAGGSSYSPALCDLVFMVEKTSQFFITGPKVIKALTGEIVTMDELGGSDIHAHISGQVQVVCKTDQECIAEIRRTLTFLADSQNNINVKKSKHYAEKLERIEDIVPENSRYSYDVKEVIHCIVDREDFMELSPKFASNIVIGLARMGEKTIGIVANQPKVFGGALDCDAADKGARFIRFCDCFNIPILVLVDVPGFYPGTLEEQKGILRHGSKMLYSFAEASVPKVTLIMRKAYGGAYCAMNSKMLGADMVYAWPTCEIAVMGADGAVDVIYHKEIENSDEPDRVRKEKIKDYEEKYLNPYYAASVSLVDEIIMPEETREKLMLAFKVLENKKEQLVEKKHGNMPL